MSVKILINKPAVEARVVTAWNDGLRALSNQILNDCNIYCKVDQTGLRSSSYIASRPEEGVLIWDTPYAKRQYWEIKTALTPGTTWKWCDTAKKKHLSEWARIAQKGLEEHL